MLSLRQQIRCFQQKQIRSALTEKVNSLAQMSPLTRPSLTHLSQQRCAIETIWGMTSWTAEMLKAVFRIFRSCKCLCPGVTAKECGPRSTFVDVGQSAAKVQQLFKYMSQIDAQ
jgi:hypothetical protein